MVIDQQNIWFVQEDEARLDRENHVPRTVERLREAIGYLLSHVQLCNYKIDNLELYEFAS